MYDSFIDQLSGLDLSGLSIRPAPFNDRLSLRGRDRPGAAPYGPTCDVLRPALEADAEDIARAWSIFPPCRQPQGSSIGSGQRRDPGLLIRRWSEVHSSNLEEQVERAQAAEASMLAFEQMREAAAALYRDETGSSWKPVSGSRTSHSRLHLAVIDARDFLRARAESGVTL